MTTQNHQPAGTPIGGQFAPTTHAEPAVSLTSADDLKGRYEATRDQYEASVQAEWVDDVRELYPTAEYAYVATAADRGGSYTAGMGLYDAQGNPITVEEDDEVAFEDAFDTEWSMSRYETTASQKIFTRKSGVFSLTAVKDHAAQVAAAAAQEPVADPFAHLTGMDKARAQGEYARQLNHEAAGAYVQDLTGKLLAINPEAARLYVNRKTDVEYGLTFTLDRVEDIHRNTLDVDLALIEDEMFQDVHLDPYITCDEDDDLGQDLFINLNTGD